MVRLLESFRDRMRACELREPLEWPVLDPLVRFDHRLEFDTLTFLAFQQQQMQLQQQQTAQSQPRFSLPSAMANELSMLSMATSRAPTLGDLKPKPTTAAPATTLPNLVADNATSETVESSRGDPNSDRAARGAVTASGGAEPDNLVSTKDESSKFTIGSANDLKQQSATQQQPSATNADSDLQQQQQQQQEQQVRITRLCFFFNYQNLIG